MTRIGWVAAGLLAALASCPKPPTAPKAPTAGEACDVPEKTVCAGAHDALICLGGKYEAQPCRQGCTTWEGQDTCSNSDHFPGEYCMSPYQNQDFLKYECTADGTSQLYCRNNHWELQKPCPGRTGCRWIHFNRFQHGTDHVECDEVVIEQGAPCAKEAQYECTVDGGATLQCRKGAWAADQPCRGADGCRKLEDKVACDDTVAEVGDPCSQDGDQRCSVDGRSLLRCKASKMVVAKTCPTRCGAAGKVRGTNPGARVECN